jgi:hypothetical protein
MTLSWGLVAVCVSELVAAWLIYRIWKSQDVTGFKIVYSAIALLPFLGPFMVIWSWNPPPPLPYDLRDQQPLNTDVMDRWRLRLSAWRKSQK